MTGIPSANCPFLWRTKDRLTNTKAKNWSFHSVFQPVWIHFVTNILFDSDSVCQCYCFNQPLRPSESEGLSSIISTLSDKGCKWERLLSFHPACLLLQEVKLNSTSCFFQFKTELGKSRSPSVWEQNTLLFVGVHTETYRAYHTYTILFHSLVRLLLKFLIIKFHDWAIVSFLNLTLIFNCCIHYYTIVVHTIYTLS